MTSPLLGSLARQIASAMSGVFLDATLTRMITPQSPAYDPADPPPPVPATYTCKAIEEEYSAGTRAQGLVGSTDVRVLILAQTLAVDPMPLDQITIRSRTVRIVPSESSGVKPVLRDPALATWQCRCQS